MMAGGPERALADLLEQPPALLVRFAREVTSAGLSRLIGAGRTLVIIGFHVLNRPRSLFAWMSRAARRHHLPDPGAGGFLF